MRKYFLRLSLSVLLLALTVATAPSAQAGCEYQRTRVTTFYAYVDALNPNKSWCTEPIVGPPCPTCYSWEPIGEIVESDCDGNSSWGDTTKCTGPNNVEYSSYVCGVICD